MVITATKFCLGGEHVMVNNVSNLPRSDQLIIRSSQNQARSDYFKDKILIPNKSQKSKGSKSQIQITELVSPN